MMMKNKRGPIFFIDNFVRTFGVKGIDKEGKHGAYICSDMTDGQVKTILPEASFSSLGLRKAKNFD